MKRKKSLPDVQDLAVVTKQQSSKQMTREEISVLSTQRRETMRRQLDEIERYKSNPLLYILNPRMKVGNIEVFTYSLWKVLKRNFIKLWANMIIQFVVRAHHWKNETNKQVVVLVLEWDEWHYFLNNFVNSCFCVEIIFCQLI